MLRTTRPLHWPQPMCPLLRIHYCQDWRHDDFPEMVLPISDKTMLTHADFEEQTYEVSNPEGDQVRVDVNQPLPLGVPLGHVTIQPQFFFNKDLEYLRYGSKGSNPALSISKMKTASARTNVD
ncbi:hypothetical protein Tco_1542854 [Tanacetum coccineum]